MSDTAADRLIRFVEDIGWKGRIVPIERLASLRDAIDDLHTRRLIDEDLYRNQLGFLSFSPPADLPGARSIIVVAVPTPQMRIVFHWRGKPVPAVAPPTYVNYTRRTETAQAALDSHLGRAGYLVAKTRLPLKTLAVRSGLAFYGRNNITYVPGMGSFLQLAGAFSDLPAGGDPWGEPRALDRCEACVVCMRKCPTGAITKERFLLHAERCLTYHNEATRDFPAWIDPSWHHCLVGCMRCQVSCPEDAAVKNWFEDRCEFSESETALFLERVPLERLPQETASKLRSLEINEDYKSLCRNLSMIVEPARSP